jgi:hypothetical protein
MDAPKIDEIFPDKLRLTTWGLVRYHFFWMEYLVLRNSRPRGGDYTQSRTVVSGPWWKWQARLISKLGPKGLSWAAPEAAVCLSRLETPPSVRTRVDAVFLVLSGFTAAATVAAHLWWNLLPLALVTWMNWYWAPRLRGLTSPRAS